MFWNLWIRGELKPATFDRDENESRQKKAVDTFLTQSKRKAPFGYSDSEGERECAYVSYRGGKSLRKFGGEDVN